MKIKKATVTKSVKHFYIDDKISLSFTHENNKITSCTGVRDGKSKTFKVVGDNVLKAFQQLEQYFKNI